MTSFDSASTPSHALIRLFSQHLTTNRLLWLLALVCFLIAWNRGIALLYGLIAMVLAVILVSWIMPWWSLRSLSASVAHHKSAQAGTPLELTITINTRTRIHQVTVYESFLTESHTYRLRHLSNGDRLHVSIPTHQRGVFPVSHVVIGCAAPFGFTTHHRHLHFDTQHLVITPSLFEITSLPNLPGQRDSQEETRFQNHSLSYQDVCGVREYRTGDSLKHIHWAASARTQAVDQSLMIREFSGQARTTWLVVIDASPEANIGEETECSFEYAIRIAASLMAYASKHHQPMHLWLDAQHPVRASTGMAGQGQDYLQQLAWCCNDSQLPYAESIHRACATYPETGTLVTIRNHSIPAEIPEWHGGHLDILLHDQSFLYPLKKYDEGWVSISSSHQQLNIHRNSHLDRLFHHDT